MAMRTYGSQRLTIYDADLATRTVTMPSQTTKLLSYASAEIELTPAPLVPTSDQGSVWKEVVPFAVEVRGGGRGVMVTR